MTANLEPDPLSAQEDETADATKRVWYRRPLTWIVVGTAIVAVAVGSNIAVVAARPTDLQASVATCHLTGSEYIKVGDGGHTVTLDGEGKNGGDGLTISKEACVLRELKVSTAAVTQMDSTTSLQGRQAADWADVYATWTYHPSNGLDLILISK